MHPLREMRLERGLSQNALPERAGVSHVTIGRVETGQAVVSELTVWKIATALGCDPHELLAASVPKPKATA